MTKAELQTALAEAGQIDKKTAGIILDTLSAIAYKTAKKKSRRGGALRLFLASICRSKGSNQRYESWLIQTGFDVMPNAANDEP